MVLYCCSSSGVSNIGSFTDPNGNTYANNFNDMRVQRYSTGSGYEGCIRLEGYRYHYSHLSYTSGVYTCNIPDRRGQSQTVTFALFSETSESYYIFSLHNVTVSIIFLSPDSPNHPQLQHVQNSNSVLTLTCETRTAPPTEITWHRDGLNLTIDGSTVQMNKTVTNRINSYFDNTLSINDDPDNVVGRYTVTVGNSRGHRTSTAVFIRGELLDSKSVLL